jgi:hypothetical protein
VEPLDDVIQLVHVGPKRAIVVAGHAFKLLLLLLLLLLLDLASGT